MQVKKADRLEATVKKFYDREIFGLSQKSIKKHNIITKTVYYGKENRIM